MDWPKIGWHDILREFAVSVSPEETTFSIQIYTLYKASKYPNWNVDNSVVSSRTNCHANGLSFAELTGFTIWGTFFDRIKDALPGVVDRGIGRQQDTAPGGKEPAASSEYFVTFRALGPSFGTTFVSDDFHLFVALQVHAVCNRRAPTCWLLIHFTLAFANKWISIGVGSIKAWFPRPPFIVGLLEVTWPPNQSSASKTGRRNTVHLRQLSVNLGVVKAMAPWMTFITNAHCFLRHQLFWVFKLAAWETPSIKIHPIVLRPCSLGTVTNTHTSTSNDHSQRRTLPRVHRDERGRNSGGIGGILEALYTKFLARREQWLQFRCIKNHTTWNFQSSPPAEVLKIPLRVR